jgi:hypothetical protein
MNDQPEIMGRPVSRRKTSTDKSMDDFAAGADKPVSTLNKKAPRNYKSLTVGLNGLPRVC